MFKVFLVSVDESSGYMQSIRTIIKIIKPCLMLYVSFESWEWKRKGSKPWRYELKSKVSRINDGNQKKGKKLILLILNYLLGYEKTYLGRHSCIELNVKKWQKQSNFVEFYEHWRGAEYNSSKKEMKIKPRLLKIYCVKSLLREPGEWEKVFCIHKYSLKCS